MKVKSIPQLKKDLDKVVSLYIRNKHADWKGDVRCFTCDKTFPVKGIQCGHYISRVYTNTRWYEPNLRPQCYSCNVMRHGNMDEFALRLERETPGILEELGKWKKMPGTPLKRQEMTFLIGDFKQKIKSL